MSMEPADYQKYLVLFVDDEDKTCKYFKRLFGETFRIVLASDGIEALEVLQQHLDEVGLVVTDQRMPNETGVAFLEKAVRLKPSLVRILSTAYADIEAAIDSVNKGGVYRYVTKPWDVADFEVTLRRAMEFFMLQTERDDLLKQKLAGVEAIAVGDRILSLAALAAVRDCGLRHVSEGLSALVQLHGICSARGTQHEISAHVPQVSWPELYRRHQSFISKAVALLPKGLAGAQPLLIDNPVAASAALSKAIGGSHQFNMVTTGDKGAMWPGPEPVVTDLVKALLEGIKAGLGPTEQVQVTDKPSGVELLLPESALKQTLEPLFGSTEGVPGEASFAIVAAFLRFASAGGTFEPLPLPGSQTVKLRIGFASSRINSPAGDSLETIASDLIGNELFWARNA